MKQKCYVLFYAWMTTLMLIIFGCGAGSDTVQTINSASASSSSTSTFRTGDDPNVCGMCGYETRIDASLVTTYSISNLPEGTYYFSITAYDENDIEGCFSDEMTQIITSTEEGVTLSWSASPDGLYVAGYKIYYGKAE